MKKAEVEIQVLTYIGSKARMAGVLSRLIPPHCTIYAELYSGSAALALNSRKFAVKILNDLNPHMANFWKIATNPDTREELLKRLQATTYSRSAFLTAKQRQREHGANQADKLQWAVDTFILNRQSFNSCGESWVYDDRDAYQNMLKNPLKLPLAFKALEGQTFRVYNDNALEVMDKEHLLDNPDAFLFLDPPYLEGLRSNGKLYQVDMPDVRDHIDLLKKIRMAKAKIVLSGYWSGRDDGTDLYDYYLLPYGWHRHLLGEYAKGCEVGATKSMGAEWVWCNYDLKVEAPGGIGFLKSYCDEEKSPCLMEWLALQSRPRGGAEG